MIEYSENISTKGSKLFEITEEQFPLEKEIQRLTINDEPQTPNKIADKLHLNQKTVQGALLELANTKKDVRWKKVGRYRLSWKTK